MLKSLSTTVFICFFAHGFSYAQEIVFCSNYDSKGEPVGASNTWNLDEKGGYVYVLFYNHNKRIKSKKLILNIRKKSGNIYRNYEKRAMEIQSNRTWALLDYQFTEAGNYKCTVQDYEGKELAMNDLTIILKTRTEPENEQNPPTINHQQNRVLHKDPDRSYYNAKTIFCRSIVNMVPTNTGSVFKAGELSVEVVNDRPLYTDTMIVDVFKKGFETEKYPIYVTSKNFWIDGSLESAYFSLNLNETGEYKVICYNRRSQTISQGYVTIR